MKAETKVFTDRYGLDTIWTYSNPELEQETVDTFRHFQCAIQDCKGLAVSRIAQ